MVSSVFPNDDAYRHLKLIRQGRAGLDPIFDGFVARFREHFGSAPLSLVTDVPERPAGLEPRPRLEIVLERTEQYWAFIEPGVGYDPTKQQSIARMFADALVEADLPSMFGLPANTPSSYAYADLIFVVFTDFERLAKIESHGLVTPAEHERFAASLDLGDQLWQIRSLGLSPIIFVHTATQADTLAASPALKRWADEYFTLVKSHDEFDYIDRAEIEIKIDSKENFDANYQSNWYYYFK